nr:MAG TPA: hypothetical protein [Caudoviricetes sp.]
MRIFAAVWLKKKLQRPAAKLLALFRSSRCIARSVRIGDEKMRELKLSSPLNIQIITEPERMALRIALDKSIGENLGMVLALKDTKREIPQGLYNSGLDYHRDNLEIYLRLRNRLEDTIYEAESNGKQRD